MWHCAMAGSTARRTSSTTLAGSSDSPPARCAASGPEVEPGEGQRPHRAGADAGAGDGGGGARKGGRPLGCRLRWVKDRHCARRPRGGTGGQPRRSRVFRDSRQPEPVLDPLPGAGRQEAGNPGAPDPEVRRDAGPASEDPHPTWRPASPGSLFAGMPPSRPRGAMPDRAKSVAAGEPAHRAPATITSQSAKKHFPGARAPQGTQARAPRRQRTAAGKPPVHEIAGKNAPNAKTRYLMTVSWLVHLYSQ